MHDLFRRSVLRPIDSHEAGRLSNTTLNDITACLVAQESELASLYEWAGQWDGAISLVVTTSAEPRSAAYNALALRLSKLRSSKFSLFGSFFQVFASRNAPRGSRALERVAIHLLHIPGALNTTIRPQTNVLLNLARFHAEGELVALFPLGLHVPPGPHLRADILEQVATMSSQVRVIPRSSQVIDPFYPASSASSDSKWGPVTQHVAQDSILVLKRDDRFWCTERFFTTIAPSRKLRAPGFAKDDPRLWEWQECLWHAALTYPQSLGVYRKKDSLRFTENSGSAPNQTFELIWGEDERGFSEEETEYSESERSELGLDVHVSALTI